MKIDMVTPSISRKSGGVGPAMLNLSENLALRDENISIDVHTLFSGEEKFFDKKYRERISIYYHARSFPESVGMSTAMISAAKSTEADIVHAHGIWMATSMYQNTAYDKHQLPYVISPHGMFDPWILSRSKLKKNVAKLFYENQSWRSCHTFHALNHQEADSIIKVLPHARVEIIPNGIDVLPFENEGSINEVRRILFLGRFHTKKNVHNLIAAINTISPSEYDKAPFLLVLAGWGDKVYVDELKLMIKNGYSERFEWIGPVFGDDKDSLYRRSDAFILPSYSEGLPVAILEAWSYGLVVIMSDFCNLMEAFSKFSAIRCGVTETDIRSSIFSYLRMGVSSQRKMASEGHRYVLENYNWDVVCHQFSQLYAQVAK
jgi:poly(glycerol-phosphate) alpha-glucosyltransferase